MLSLLHPRALRLRYYNAERRIGKRRSGKGRPGMGVAQFRRVALLLGSVWLCAGLAVPGLARPLFAPPAADEQQLFLLMGLTGSASILIAWLLHQPWLTRRLRSLRQGLMLLSLLTILTLFANFWLLARQMFLDAHDLGLSAVLLVFGAWTALGCGYFISTAFTGRILALAGGAERLARGELGTRVAAEGQDELAQLAQSFNVMAGRLEEAAVERERIEQGRRDLIAVDEPRFTDAAGLAAAGD